MIYREKELYHHGVKGQQWGVRNGPPYPIEDKVLKKGTKLNSVSAMGSSELYRKTGKWMYTYNPDDKWDSKIYKGPFASYANEREQYRILKQYANKVGTGSPIYASLYNYVTGTMFIREHSYKTVKNLKMPNSNERMAEFKDLYNDPKFEKDVKDDLRKYQSMLTDPKYGFSAKDVAYYGSVNVDKIKTANDYKVAYSIFNHAMEQVHRNISTQEYAKRMSKKYDAMVDDNNQGVYNEAHDPVIIFKANKSLKQLSDKGVLLTNKEVRDNMDYLRAELKKKGKNLKL